MSDTTSAGYEDCPVCEGKGGIYGPQGYERECVHCGGTGKVEVNQYLEWEALGGIPPWERRKTA